MLSALAARENLRLVELLLLLSVLVAVLETVPFCRDW
jgi:hypothetical protein